MRAGGRIRMARKLEPTVATLFHRIVPVGRASDELEIDSRRPWREQAEPRHVLVFGRGTERHRMAALH